MWPNIFKQNEPQSAHGDVAQAVKLGVIDLMAKASLTGSQFPK